MTTTTYRGFRISISARHDGPHLVTSLLVTGSEASPFVRVSSEATTIGLTTERASEVALANAVRWIDSILPPDAPRAR